MTRVGQFENQAEREIQEYIDYLEQLKTGVELGTVSAVLADELNLTPGRIQTAIDNYTTLSSAIDLTSVYLRLVDGDFEQAGIEAAELAAARAIQEGLSDILLDSIDTRVLSELGLTPAQAGGIVDVASAIGAESLIDFSQGVINAFVEVATEAIQDIPKGEDFVQASLRSLKPLENKLNSYIDNSANVDGFNQLVIEAGFAVNYYAASFVADLLPNLNIFSNPEIVEDAITGLFDINNRRVVINVQDLRNGGLDLVGLDEAMGSYATNFIESQLFLNPNFEAGQLLTQVPLYVLGVENLVLTELSGGFANVQTLAASSLFILDKSDKGVGSDSDDIFLGGNELLGKDGNDILITNQNSLSVTIKGGAGDDEIHGSLNDDVHLSGGAGRDTIYGYAGADILNGNGGRDHLYGGDGIDTISGGGGRDIISGGDDGDILSGGNGNDFVFGEDGDDTIIIEDTFFAADDGTDFYDGGEGYDTLDASQSNRSLILDYALMSDPNSGSDVMFDIEQIIGSSESDHILNWEQRAPSVPGEEFVFRGMGGSDTLSVDGGEITFVGGAGQDELIVESLWNPTRITFDMGTDDDGSADIVRVDPSPGGALVIILGGEANDEVYSNDSSLAVVIDDVIGDAFEGWQQRDDGHGNVAWEWAWNGVPDSEITRISYRVDTGALEISTADGFISVEDFDNGDLGIIIPDNPFGPGIGGGSNQRIIEHELLLMSNSQSGEIERSTSGPLPEYTLDYISNFAYEHVDDWGLFA